MGALILNKQEQVALIRLEEFIDRLDKDYQERKIDRMAAAAKESHYASNLPDRVVFTYYEEVDRQGVNNYIASYWNGWK